MTSPLSILSARFAEVAIPTPRERTGHVYLLVDGDEVVYVGQTIALEQRIAWHWEQSRAPVVARKRRQIENPHCKPFDRALALEAPEGDLRDIEGALIRALRPRFNHRADTHRGNDNKILASLGLPAHADEKANAADYRKTTYQPRGPRPEREKQIVAAARAQRRKHPSQVRVRLRRALWRAVKPLLAGAS